MCVRHSHARQGGFTLLETLVVVVVLGLLIVGLGRGVQAGLALWSAQQRRIDQIAELDAGARLLRSLLTGIAVPAAAAAGGTATDIQFNGDAEHLSFVGDLPTGLGTTRRADIKIALRRANLVLTWTPHLHEIRFGPPPPSSDTELVTNVAHLDIGYWGAATPDQPAAWLTQWDGPTPPALVRIRLLFVKGDQRRWPDLIVAPLL
jgi:general secretion pathway protein J